MFQHWMVSISITRRLPANEDCCKWFSTLIAKLFCADFHSHIWAFSSTPNYFFLAVWFLSKEQHQKNKGNKKAYGNPNSRLEKLSNHRTTTLFLKPISCVQHRLTIPLATSRSGHTHRIQLPCNLIPRAATLPH